MRFAATCRAAIPPAVRRCLWPVRRRLFPSWDPMAEENVTRLEERLRSLQGRYAGRRCFIMGNGPSLNRMNLDLFKEEYVWGANRCHLLFDRIAWRPLFYVAVDTRVVPDIADEIGQLMEDLPATTFFFPLDFRRRRILWSRPNVYWYWTRFPDFQNPPYGAFTRDASQFVSDVKTVTLACVQLAAYLGFNPIYLFGCDTTYKVPATVVKGESRPERLTSTADDDQNHFDPRYFGAGRKWHEPHPEQMIMHYGQAKQACDNMGVQVYNATVGGQLEVFPRVDYREVLRRSA